jgi:hypothetical protein
MRHDEIEAEVGLVHRAAGFDEDEPVPILDVARAYLGGPESIRTLDRWHCPGDGFSTQVRGRRVIFLRSGLPPERVRFALAHELAECRLDEVGYREEDRETVANVMAASHLVRPRPLRAALSRGATIAEIAHEYVLTETCIALRIGEATGLPLAVVSPLAVRVRGEPWGWPESTTEIRRLGRLAVASLRRLELQDARGRFVLLADRTERDTVPH